MRFIRHMSIENLDGTEYIVVSRAVSWMFGFDTIVGYVIWTLDGFKRYPNPF